MATFKGKQPPEAVDIVAARSRQLAHIANAFKDLIEASPATATPAMREEACRQLWGFAAFREEVREEMTEIAWFFATRTGNELPPDFELKIARLSVAVYFLDRMDEMIKVVMERKSPGLIALFESTAQSFHSMFNGFFSKSNTRIINEYLDCETTLVSCATSCSVGLVSLEQAVIQNKMRVANEIDRMLADITDN